MEPTTYDLIVIGSGPAGESGAETAAIFGKRVALIEKNPLLGGASTNTGTLPSKTLRETALAISGLKSRDLYGVDLSLRREAGITDFMYHERRVTANERRRVGSNLERHGITLYRGAARFEDAHTIRVSPVDPAAAESSDVLLRAEKVLIATGSSPIQPPGFAFAHPRVHDSDEILELDHLPKTMAVIGAGVIGSEYACTFAALGTKVFVIDGRDKLMPYLDAEVSEALEAAMRHLLGITFIWKERATDCEAPETGDVTLTLSSGSTLDVEAVLIAAGRSSNTGSLNLQAAGITPGRRGVLEVDSHYRTSVPHIYAAGDVIGSPALASTSMEQARAAMCHAFQLDYEDFSPLLPSGIYTIPEVSMLGPNEAELKQKGVDYVVGRAPYSLNARGAIIGDKVGFLKLLFNRADMKLLGVHVIGEHASEVVHIGLMAMLTNNGADLFLKACFNYPTLGDLYKHATFDALLNKAGLARDDDLMSP